MDKKLKISDLLLDCAKYPEVYNDINIRLCQLFGIQNAETSLIVTWFILKDRGLLNENV